MRIYLGALMLVIVSGESEVTINGTLGGSVLLPCDCPNRNLSKEFKWQMDEKSVIYKSSSSFSTSYKDRTKVFVDENISNCSLLLTNITANDQGKYRCCFHIGKQYNYTIINLNISAKPTHQDTAKREYVGSPTVSPPEPKYVMRYYKYIPIGVVFVLSLVLWRRWKISQGLPGASQVEMDSVEC